MKEKISNEQREKIIARNRDRAQVATLIRSTLDKYPYSQECVECSTGNPLFNDSCNFVGLHHELMKLADTLNNMVEYEKALLENYYE